VITNSSAFSDFVAALGELATARPELFDTTMSNVFSLRDVGNKTHGDLAEVAIAEFVNAHLDEYSARHVGKDLFRQKTAEEDIEVTAPDGTRLPISLKAYGSGPLQLSTNKSGSMWETLSAAVSARLEGFDVQGVVAATFQEFAEVNVLPLIYDEARAQYNIMVFDLAAAFDGIRSVELITPGGRRKHPLYRFLDASLGYVCEVRYGSTAANALQRGLWTHTVHGARFFRSITGWRQYRRSEEFLQVLAEALIAEPSAHGRALAALRNQ
jgi:hypothetical protein